MSTKNFQFFALPEEFLQLLQALAEANDLWLVAPDNGRYRQMSLDELAGGSIDSFEHIFIATSPPTDDQLEADEIVPAKFGWLQMDIPKRSGKQLFLADFAMKSDWYDLESKNVLVNTQLARAYRRLRKRLRDLLGSPVWARNVKTGEASAYSDMGISLGAERWEKGGGELRQRGVENIRFYANGDR